MKWKIIAGVAVLLILAQIIYGGKRAAENTAPSTAPETAAVDGAPTETGETPPETAMPAPSPDDVVAVAVGENGGDLRLERSEHGWTLANRDGAPADSEKVDILLRGLLSGARRPVALGEIAETGLEDGGGLPIGLSLKNGGSYDVRLGLRPAGAYDAAYVRFPDGRAGVVPGDIRGDLGLWRNTPDARPDVAAWLQKTALSFNVSDVEKIEATYPDHHILFEKSPEDAWQPRDYVPGGEWSHDALVAWLNDLSDFRIDDIAASDEFPHDETGKTHNLAVTLADGSKKTVRVQPNHGGGGMLAATSDFPGRVFHLPEWRFKKYFRRLPFLFPDAVPNYDLSQIHFIDILRNDKKVKIARRDGGWETVAERYPLKPEQVERLARLLSGWRPEDYAAPDFKAVRPNYGPMVEVTLANNKVHQYRLAGRHPLFPWRYVTLDGQEIFSVTDAEAGVMFPGFADIMDLGRVFNRMTLEDVDRVELSDADGKEDVAIVRNGDGSWSIGGEGQELGLMPIETERILGELVQWRVTGFYNVDSHSGRYPPQHRIRLIAADGKEQSITILHPEERDIPFIADGNHGYLMERTDVQNWLGATREAARRLHLAIERAKQDEEEREAEARKAAMELTEKASDARAGIDEETGFGEGDDAESSREDDAAESSASEAPDRESDAGESRHGDVEIPDTESRDEDPGDERAGRPEEKAGEGAEDSVPEAGDDRAVDAPADALDVETVAAGSDSHFADADHGKDGDGDADESAAAEDGTGGSGIDSDSPDEAVRRPEEALRSAGAVVEVLDGESSDTNAAAEPDDSEKTDGEPAGGDLLIHPVDDMNVVGDTVVDADAEAGVLVPEAETLHNASVFDDVEDTLESLSE